MNPNKNTKLSRAVLDMKFMKRTKEKVEKDAEDAIGSALYSHEVTEDMKKRGATIYVEANIAKCKNLIEGRLSFGGMNPEIEKIMAGTYAKRLEEIELQKEKEINDVEMANTLVNTVGKKFTPKRNRNRKFMKPQPME